VSDASAPVPTPVSLTTAAAAQGSAQARATLRGVLRLQLLANGLGLAVVILYLRILVPQASAGARGQLNLTVFGGYLVVNLVIFLPVNVVLLRRAVVWVRNGTTPTDRQRWLVFRLPLLETVSALVAWLGGATAFGVINTGVRREAFGLGLAGFVTCTLLYLLLEGHFRPVFALALIDAELPKQRRDVLPRLMLAWFLGSGLPLITIGLLPLLVTERLSENRFSWLALASLLGGGAVMAAAAVSVARPLGRVRQALRQVERGDFDIHVPVDDLGELGRLAEGVNDLVEGLRERDALKTLFEHQVGPAQLAVLGAGADRVGERRRVTVLFVDLQGYTRFSERHMPEDVVAMLNRFFRVVVAAVTAEGGWVNKFEGDAALCIFGAPEDTPDHAARALRAAAAIPPTLAADREVLPAGVGVATGDVLAGFVGTPERYEYTVIGDVVNLASRLCEGAKEQRSGVLASETTVIESGLGDEWQHAGSFRVRGRRERAEVYTLPSGRRRDRGRRE